MGIKYGTLDMAGVERLKDSWQEEPCPFIQPHEGRRRCKRATQGQAEMDHHDEGHHWEGKFTVYLRTVKTLAFLTFPACFQIPIIFSDLNSNCSNSLDMRNLQEQDKKAFCYQKLFWPFTFWLNCSSDLKLFANSQPSDLNFKSFLDP